MSKRTKVLVADDHTLVREGIKQILAASGEIGTCGEAGDGFETLARIRAEDWDILLLDMSMPGRSGVDLIRQIKGEKPALPILVLSMYKEDEYAVRAIRAGASGYLCKDSAAVQLLSAIRKVAAGGHFISPEVAGELAYGLIVKADKAPHELLSDREFQIFRMLATGDGVAEIAQRLNLSPKTVSTYKTRLLQKMNMGSVAELVRYGLAHALFDELGAS